LGWFEYKNAHYDFLLNRNAVNELINLKEKQVDFSRKQLKILGKGNKERIIPAGWNCLL
jgi:site-specific recombinase XerD